MDFFPILTTDTSLPRRPTLKANPPPTAHQPLPVGVQPPPLLHCGSWGLPSPQTALGTGGKRQDNLSAQNNLCYIDLSLDNYKTEVIKRLANSESNPYQIRESNLEILGEGNGNPLQCSCLENPRDRGAWWAAVSGVAQSWTRLKRLSSSSSKLEILNSGSANRSLRAKTGLLPIFIQPKSSEWFFTFLNGYI